MGLLNSIQACGNWLWCGDISIWVDKNLKFCGHLGTIYHKDCLLYPPYLLDCGDTKVLTPSCPWLAFLHNVTGDIHTMDLLWEKFQWILPVYMKPISFQSKASVVCSVTAAWDYHTYSSLSCSHIYWFLPEETKCFPNILVKKQMNIWIPQNKSLGIEMLINFLC